MEKYQVLSYDNEMQDRFKEKMEDDVIEKEDFRRSGYHRTLLASTSLVVGAATVAGLGLGIVSVIGGAYVIGMAAESILVPSLLLKFAGGIAGGGVGMAKGVQYAIKEQKRERDDL